MLNGNTQLKFRAGKDKAGTIVEFTGQDLVDSIEVYTDPALGATAVPFTLADKAENFTLTMAQIAGKGLLYVDGSSKRDGILDGGTPVSNGAVLGTNKLDVTSIGGLSANVVPLLDKDFDEVLTKEGKLVYAVLSTSGADGDTVADNNVQASFAIYNDTGALEVYTKLKAGDYCIQPHAVYNFGFARVANLNSGKAKGIGGGGAGASSYEEVVELIQENMYVNASDEFKLTTDVTGDPKYNIKLFINDADASRNVFANAASILAVGTLVLDTTFTTGTGINKPKGTGYFPAYKYGVSVYINGIRIPSQFVVISQDGASTTIEVIDTQETFKYGLFKDDIITFNYEVKPA